VAKLDRNTNYFASMTDMMVGILFVFIIMIAYFAFQIQQTESVPKEIYDQVVAERDTLSQTVEELEQRIEELERIIGALRLELAQQASEIEQKNAEIESLKAQLADLLKALERLRMNPLQRFVEASSDVRDTIIENVIRELSEKGIDARSVQRGVVTISGKGLFASGSSDLRSVATALDTVDTISDVVAYELRCFIPDTANAQGCKAVVGNVDSIYIEGHTDNGKVLGQLPDGSRTNLELSSRRATNTYERIVLRNPNLTDIRNPAYQQALSVAAYGEQRPIQNNDTPEGQEANRRIDIRFEMYTPDSLSELSELYPEWM
jgi:chemotaxis protein MotB